MFRRMGSQLARFMPLHESMTRSPVPRFFQLGQPQATRFEFGRDGGPSDKFSLAMSEDPCLLVPFIQTLPRP